MNAVSEAGLTLNGPKCSFGTKEIKFWGMIYSAAGVHPDPEKIEALDNIPRPTNKKDLRSFVCMMQSNSEFIPNFAKKIAPLRDLASSNTRFKWSDHHQQTFESIIADFKECVALSYFDMNQNTFVFTDGHKSGLGAILAQGETRDKARPVAFASRCTNKAEKGYSQLDLEAMSVDYALRRFRNYLVGSPHNATVVTDHNPLLGVFNGKRSGSIRSERIKMRHQDIPFKVEYQKGSKNAADFLSRHARSWSSLSSKEQEESNDLTNLLYAIHVSPFIDAISIKTIAEHTSNDVILQKLLKLVKDGKTYTSDPDLKPFCKILSEITYTSNGVLFKYDKIILPQSLHDTTVKLAHAGGHPGQDRLKRRLRSHFFMLVIDSVVKTFVEQMPGLPSLYS